MIEELTAGELSDFLASFGMILSEQRDLEKDKPILDQGVVFDEKKDEMIVLVDFVTFRVPAYLDTTKQIDDDFDQSEEKSVDRIEIYQREKIYLSENGIGFENEEFKNHVLKINDVSEEDLKNEWIVFLLDKENKTELTKNLYK